MNGYQQDPFEQAYNQQQQGGYPQQGQYGGGYDNGGGMSLDLGFESWDGVGADGFDGEYTPIPEGWYLCVFSKFEMGMTKQNMRMLKSELTVQEGEHDGTLLRTNFNIGHSKPDVRKMAQSQLFACFAACNLQPSNDPSAMLQLPFYVKVVVRPARVENGTHYGESNDIKAFRSIAAHQEALRKEQNQQAMAQGMGQGNPMQNAQHAIQNQIGGNQMQHSPANTHMQQRPQTQQMQPQTGQAPAQQQMQPQTGQAPAQQQMQPQTGGGAANPEVPW